tara:strand:- start:4937 stop:7669 length:2733 start_codon:yes stop_codon:yes gene_type:complete
MSSVYVIGSGSREHVIIETLLLNNNIDNVYVYPGNSGILALDKVSKSLFKPFTTEFFEFTSNFIDFVIPSTELELVSGISDALNQRGIRCFGPSAYAARIEGSKIFSKNFMKDNNIPTSDFEVFNDFEKAKKYLISIGYDKVVIKVSGLAAGKGVVLPENIEEGVITLKEMLIDKKFGNAGEEIIIEKRLKGQEVSIMAFCNGNDIHLMPQSQDYKRYGDNDQGLNTGGMGSHAPVYILNESELEIVRQHMLVVVRKLNYKGVLYGGLMKTDDGIYFLEFNCRFGDPEAQVLLNLLKTDLLTIINDCILGNPLKIEWKSGYASNVVLSHSDYPIKKSENLLKISGLNLIEQNIKIYWANVSEIDNEFYTTGGRVASIVSYSEDMYDSINQVYNNISKIDYEGIYYRRDICLKHLTKQCGRRKIKIAVLGSTNGTSMMGILDKIGRGELNASIEVIVSNKKAANILSKGIERGISNVYLPCRKSETNLEYDRKLITILSAYDVDVVYLIGYMKIVTKNLIDEYNGRIFNIHPSLLPKYPGLMDISVHEEVIKNNEKTSGCTLHHVTEEVDAGKIALQKQCFVNTNDPYELKAKVQELESQLFIEHLRIMSNIPLTYKSSGVDVNKGNQFVDYIKNLTKKDKKSDKIGGFCAEFTVNGLKLAAATDGVGTKIDIARMMNKYDTIGIDLVAMSINDLLTQGFYPLIFLDYIAVDRISSKLKDIVKGIHDGCKIANCELIGGETAEMSGIYQSGQFDLAGFAVGYQKYIIPTNDIKKGDLIYGLSSNGVHSNGYSLIRKLLKTSTYDLNELLKPTKIYMEIFDIIEKYKDNVYGISHITGGGFGDNIERILPHGLSIELNEWIFPDVFQWIQNESGMSREEMLNTYNCGYGMIIIVRNKIDSQEFALDLIGKIV